MDNLRTKSYFVCALLIASAFVTFVYGASAGYLDFPGLDVRVNDYQPAGKQFNASVYVDSGGTIHVVWQDHSDSHPDIWYAQSTNGGTSFSTPAVVNDDSPQDHNHRWPSVTVSANGWIHVVWADDRDIDVTFEDRIYYARSENGGLSFSTNIPVSEDTPKNPGVTLGLSGLVVPSLTVHDSTPCYLHVAWGAERSYVSALDTYGAYYDRSIDCGQSFGTDVELFPVGMGPDVSVDSAGNPHVVFVATDPGIANSNLDVWHMWSSDKGAAWTYTSRTMVSEVAAYGHMQPTIAIDVSDNVHVAWADSRNVVEYPLGQGFYQDWDIFYSKSTDLGTSFGANVKVNDDTLGFIPDQYQPSIDTDHLSNPHIAWSDWRNDDEGRYWPHPPDQKNDVDVYYARSEDAGASFRENGQASDNYIFRQKRPSLQTFVEPGTTGPTYVYLAWEDERNWATDDFDIYFTSSTVSPQLSFCAGWSDGVDPDEGVATTLFTFCVKYSDLEDDPPRYWPATPDIWLHVLDSSKQEISGSPFPMSTFAGWVLNPNDWRLGAEFETDLYLPVGSYYHFFTATDSTDHDSGPFPSSPADGPDVYEPPTLSWCTGAGYGIGDGVDPDQGDTSMTFTYCVVYTQVDDLWPHSIRVHIQSASLSYDEYFDVVWDGIDDPSNGAVHTYDHIFSDPATDYTYQFEVELFQGSDTVFLPPSSPADGPDVYATNYPPELYGAKVSPSWGRELDTLFKYIVVYRDLDNCPPSYVRVHIDYEVVGRDMSPDPDAQGDLSDGNYANGEQYSYVTQLDEGRHHYHFEASDGHDTVRSPGSGEYVGPIVTVGSGPWVTFHHDNERKGYSDSKVPDNPKPLWHRETSDPDMMGTSSPAVWGDTVYFGTDAGLFFALDEGTGDDRWVFDAGGPEGPLYSKCIRSSPGVAQGMVFFSSDNGKIYSLDADPSDGIDEGFDDPTGVDYDVIWVYDTGFPLGSLHCEPFANIRSSPAIQNDRVFIGWFDGKMYAFDADPSDDVDEGFDDPDGVDYDLIWVYVTAASIWASPSIADGKVVFGCYCRYLYALDITTGTPLWIRDFGADALIRSSAAIDSGRVFVGLYEPGGFLCLDLSNGNTVWEYDRDGPDYYRSSAAVHGDRVFVAPITIGNPLICLDADPSDGVDEGIDDPDGVEYDLIWESEVGGWSNRISPAVADGVVITGYIGWPGGLKAFLESDGSLLWTFAPGDGGMSSSPAVADGLVFITVIMTLPSEWAFVYALRDTY